jgi:hypothetical protein
VKRVDLDPEENAEGGGLSVLCTPLVR